MTVKIGLVGTGTVGGGCIDIIKAHREDFKRNFGVDIELSRVCSFALEQAQAHGVADIFTTDFNDIVNDPEIDIVVELIGGVGAAATLVKSALAAGKHVVTANKALIASDGKAILELAERNGLELAFEAAVGGGIPIIGPLQHCLTANDVSSVMGIVNGTTNYMLTRMAQDGLSYEDALAEAQERGFAEADPTADVDGLDAAAKIAILASIAFHARVTLDQVPAEGIRAITAADLKSAQDMGYTVKLLAIANKAEGGISVRVHPTMIPNTHPLANVNGVFNAIYVVGDAVGQTMFFGEGAGAGPAASAVMGDVLEVARHVQQHVKPLAAAAIVENAPLLPMDDVMTKYYIRFKVQDRSGVLAATSSVFAQHNVSVQSVSQRGSGLRGPVDLIYITHTAQEAAIRQVIDQIKQKDDVLLKGTEPVVIRVEDPS